MPGFKITDMDGNKIEFQSDSSTETFWNSHMFKDAILELIGMADFSKWDQEDNELSSNDFIKLVITALAERWYWENPASEDTSNVKEQLLQMIEYLELDKITLSFEDDDE